ncbi:ATP-binding protein [Herbidospora cretacea]|uniref:ATP-binding protein n=1 Tax=Herbidospora cretacea TaxID=28444 RepID=UPI0004C40CB0|nr:ATP-binding protein [Herbidospora cretacea]
MSVPFAVTALDGLDDFETWSAECLLPAVGASVAEARRLVRRELTSRGCVSFVDDCQLIVSELVTNAVRHAGTAFALRLRGTREWVYGEVFDTGPAPPRQREARPDATDGRGLLIVGTLAASWGYAPGARGGKIVWFVLGDS